MGRVSGEHDANGEPNKVLSEPLLTPTITITPSSTSEVGTEKPKNGENGLLPPPALPWDHDVAYNPTTWEKVKSTMRINPKLLPVKLLVFLVHGGIAALFPFFTLHMRAVGISIKEMSWMLFVLPIVSSIGPPLGGALADRLGNYKLVLIVFTIISVILHLLLWFAVDPFGTRDVNVPITMNDTEFLMKFPCHPEKQLPTTFFMQSPREKRIKNCNLTSSWMPANLVYCFTDCLPAGPSGAKVCFNGLRNSSNCYNWMEVESFQITGAKEPTKTKNNATAKVPARPHRREEPTTPPPWTSPAHFDVTGFSAPKHGLVSLKKAYCTTRADIPCSVSCMATSENALACHEINAVPFGDRVTTLALYFTFRFLSFTAVRVVFPLLDAAVLEISREHKGDFGIQRLFASVGFVLLPPLSGYLCDLASRKRGGPDYSPAFYLFAGMNVLGAILMLFMKISVRKKQTNIWLSIGTVLTDPSVFFFSIAILIGGAAFGFLVNFLFLFMENDAGFATPLDNPKRLFGLTSAVGYLVGIPLLFFSTQLIRLFGLENLLAFGLLCYGLRLVTYSFTYDQYLILPTEILTGVTGMILVLMPQFAIKTAPKYLATLVGLFGALNFGLGGGLGPLVGGLLVHKYDYRTAFQVCSGICAGVAAVYFIVYHLFLKRRKPRIPEPVGPAELAGGGPVPVGETAPVALANVENDIANDVPRKNSGFWNSPEGVIFSGRTEKIS